MRMKFTKEPYGSSIYWYPKGKNRISNFVVLSGEPSGSKRKDEYCVSSFKRKKPSKFKCFKKKKVALVYAKKLMREY